MVLKREANQRRRAHRVDLPMAVEIDGRAFEVIDWSLTGLAARIPEDLPLAPDEERELRLHIPLPGGRVVLEVRGKVVGQRDGERVAFTFVDPPPHVRRVLRHYIELGVQGELGRVEDLVSILSQPDLPTPVRDALLLEDEEDTALVRGFRRRAIGSVALGVGFLLFVAVTVFYNVVYRIEAQGTAIGQVRHVRALATGVLERLAVRPGQQVRAGQLLFALDGRDVTARLAGIERRLELVRTRLLGGAVATATTTAAPIRPAALTTGGRDPLPVPLFRPQAQSRPPDADQLARLLERRAALETERRLLRMELARRVGVAPEDGRVVRITAEPGDRVAEGRTVVLLEVDRPPLIVARVREDQVRRLHPGMEAVVTPREGAPFRARIIRIGYEAVDPDFPLASEVSLHEVPVLLEPEDPSVRVPAFTRVDVWIRTFAR